MTTKNYYETQRSIAAAVNAELGGSVLLPRSVAQQVTTHIGSLPNGDQVIARIEYGDACGNGHNTLSITGEVWEKGAAVGNRREKGLISCGRVHEQIIEAMPYLANLIPWHLCSTDGPMHYFANTLYLAGDKDCNGLRKGESRQIRNGKTGLPAWKLVPFVDGVQADAPQKYVDSETCPPATAELRYVPWCTVGEGKERQFDAARRIAIWPDATDEQLSLPSDELAELLAARLPALIREFHRIVTVELGFKY